MMRQQTNNRFRRDDRQLDEDEELWFDNDEDFEEDTSQGSVSSGSGEPVKAVVSPVSACEKVAQLQPEVPPKARRTRPRTFPSGVGARSASRADWITLLTGAGRPR